MIANHPLRLKSIQELLDFHFFIPSYQRGYRWTDVQVQHLLSDLYEFQNKKNGLFYCLQPITVKQKSYQEKSVYEVIDGQQRLTTIYILLTYLNDVEFKRPKKKFSIAFETRVDENEEEPFLENIAQSNRKNENIDFFHIYKAYQTIDEWFVKEREKNDAIERDLHSTLVNLTKVIWYEIPNEQDDKNGSIDIFTRLNLGKIQLTNSELIKGLFLRNDNFPTATAHLKKLQIATEWDNMESTLQRDDFWHFIYCSEDNISYETRIEYLFDLMAQRPKEAQEQFTFNYFKQKFEEEEKEKGRIDIDKQWLAVKKYFLTLNDWFHNRKLYHLTGFLIETKTPVNDLKVAADTRTKLEFERFLQEKIAEKIPDGIADLSYEKSKDKDKIRLVLLLFNIQTLLQNESSHLRFPFYRFVQKGYDIEHVRSQTEPNFNGRKERLIWAKNVLSYFTGIDDFDDENFIEKSTEKVNNLEERQQKVGSLLLKFIQSETNDASSFLDAFQEVAKFFKEDKEPEDIHGISNLTLLDATTNRSYKNAPFPVKRKIILKNDQKGVFIPLCTKNLFTKAYSPKVDEVMYWQKEDAAAYLKKIQDTVSIYQQKTTQNDSK